ncbi:hypothetical protein J3R30DRAFT_3406073 [Lentinula aciculospora]|uniref:Uncharacterized protein n=1 Tax=Lentinula aciculospora TaxID=153920 RepID=A0A9W9A6U1_9AGAR|nr:hypothetical protein J3R30DRAFT_3406073 [Lentinula aciculospora]
MNPTKLYFILILGVVSLVCISGVPVVGHGSTANTAASSSSLQSQDGLVELKAIVTFPAAKPLTEIPKSFRTSKSSDSPESSNDRDKNANERSERPSIEDFERSVEEGVQVILDKTSRKLTGGKASTIAVSEWNGHPEQTVVQGKKYYEFTVKLVGDSFSASLGLEEYPGRFLAKDFDEWFWRWKYHTIFGRLIGPNSKAFDVRPWC